MTNKHIVVLGPLNMDLVFRTPRIPLAGEGLTATSFHIGFGGKGSNVSTACARLSPDPTSAAGTQYPRIKTSLIGFVGDDQYGTDIVNKLKAEGVNMSRVQVAKGFSTGIANIMVDDQNGENRMILASNANHCLGREIVDLIPGDADVAIFQLELPLPLTLHNIKLAKRQGAYVIFNPSPAVPLPDDIYPHVDCLIVNDTEADTLCSGKRDAFARECFDMGVRDLVVTTHGSHGADFMTKSGHQGHVPAEQVEVVDTTGAGDTFIAGLAIHVAAFGTGSVSENEKAMQFASKAAAKTVGRKGALDAIPNWRELMT